MKNSMICPKCSSNKIMFPVDTVAYPGALQVAVPHLRTIMKINIPDSFSLQAAVCGTCGYTELYVNDPDLMYQKWTLPDQEHS